MRVFRVALFVTAALFSFVAVAPVPMFVPPSGFDVQAPSTNSDSVVQLMPASQSLDARSFAIIDLLATPAAGKLSEVSQYFLISSNWTNLKPSMKHLTVCDAPADELVVTSSQGKLKTASTILMTIRNGTFFISTYERTVDIPDDPIVERWLSSSCPAPVEMLHSVAPPAGWINGSGSLVKTTPLGRWQQHERRGAVGLLRIDGHPAMSDIAKSLRRVIPGTNPAGTLLELTSLKVGHLCGHPAIFAVLTNHFVLFTFPYTATYTAAYTENDTQTVAATYYHLSNVKPDTAALRSLQTLCADGIPPATPTPEPTPAPTPTPQ